MHIFTIYYTHKLFNLPTEIIEIDTNIPKEFLVGESAVLRSQGYKISIVSGFILPHSQKFFRVFLSDMLELIVLLYELTKMVENNEIQLEALERACNLILPTN